MQILIQVHVKISIQNEEILLNKIFIKKLHNTIANLHPSKINYLCKTAKYSIQKL